MFMMSIFIQSFFFAENLYSVFRIENTFCAYIMHSHVASEHY
jgi:hypothetical protein